MFSLKTWLLGLTGKSSENVNIDDIKAAYAEVQIREIAFLTCVNMIANAISKCTFRTYISNTEVRGTEHYLWNIDPNVNQNSTMFLHKLIAKLYEDNEALVIETKPRGDLSALVVADSFNASDEWATKQREYTQVRVGNTSYQKTFRENEVLHFKLHNSNLKGALDGIADAYAKLVSLTLADRKWKAGRHWKVHIDQIDTSVENWQENLQKMITDQMSTFFGKDISVLPETNGYKYEDVGSGDSNSGNTRDLRALIDDIFDFTSIALGIPPVLVRGGVADSKDAVDRWLTTGIDPLCDQLEEEIIKKRYGFEEWSKGNYIEIDTSAIQHFDLLSSATNIDKLIGSGFCCINDVRKATGQQIIDEPWAWQHFITKNYSTVEDFLNSLGGGS